MKNLFIGFTIFFSFGVATADPVVKISLLTNKIILVHFDEGFLSPALYGQPEDNDTLTVSVLDTTSAIISNNYGILSLDDSNYSTVQNPINIYRKSKPTAFKNDCDSWGLIPYYNTNGCINNSVDHADEHFIYLELTNELVQGKTYTITLTNILSSPETFDLIYDETQLRSEAVHVNNIGYSTGATAKYAYVYSWLGDGGSLDLSAYANNQFSLIDQTNGAVAYTGTLKFRKDKTTIETFQNNPLETPDQNFIGAEVYECDFSNFNTPGLYAISIEGIGSSFKFEISCNVLRKPFESVMKGIFNNRSGVTIDNPNTEALRNAPHNPISTPGFNGQLKYTSTTICDVSDADASANDRPLWEAGILGNIEDSYGWYQDAGDWDAYLRHMDVPAKLMFTYEHFSSNFIDGQLNIIESGNGIPDILDEARWLIRFYKRLKDETESKGWTDGGIPGGRIFGDLWGEDLGPNDIIRGSWDDNDRTWVVSGQDAFSSYMYAGLCAHLDWIYTQFGFVDPENINWQQEAIDAYNWAVSNSSQGDYCQDDLLDEFRLYAAAALYRSTSLTTYESDFVDTWDYLDYSLTSVLDGNPAFGGFIYQNTDLSKDPTVDQETIDIIELTSDFILLDNVDLRACRWGGNHFFPMLVGHGTTPFVFEGLIGMKVIESTNPSKAADYLESLYNTVDYFLGNNPLNMTWISGLGERSPQGILHLDSWATGDGQVKAGIVPYGPWRSENFGSGVGSFSHVWPEQWVYPAFSSWPGHERWFEQRYSPLTSEFTIDQNLVNAAATYGALSGEYDCNMVSGLSNIEVSTGCIEVKPNPSDNYFVIQGVLPEYIINVINAQGAVVLQVPNEGSEILINTDHLGSGIYFVNVSNSSNNNLCTQKIIKM